MDDIHFPLSFLVFKSHNYGCSNTPAPDPYGSGVGMLSPSKLFLARRLRWWCGQGAKPVDRLVQPFDLGAQFLLNRAAIHEQVQRAQGEILIDSRQLVEPLIESVGDRHFEACAHRLRPFFTTTSARPASAHSTFRNPGCSASRRPSKAKLVGPVIKSHASRRLKDRRLYSIFTNSGVTF